MTVHVQPHFSSCYTSLIEITRLLLKVVILLMSAEIAWDAFFLKMNCLANSNLC